MFCLNFAFGRLLPFVSILRQLESEQNVRFYINLAQYVMHPSATLQNERRIFHFGRCRMYYSGLIQNRFSKLQQLKILTTFYILQLCQQWILPSAQLKFLITFHSLLNLLKINPK